MLVLKPRDCSVSGVVPSGKVVCLSLFSLSFFLALSLVVLTRFPSLPFSLFGEWVSLKVRAEIVI